VAAGFPGECRSPRELRQITVSRACRNAYPEAAKLDNQGDHRAIIARARQLSSLALWMTILIDTSNRMTSDTA
jgi:hypothetical protein